MELSRKFGLSEMELQLVKMRNKFLESCSLFEYVYAFRIVLCRHKLWKIFRVGKSSRPCALSATQDQWLVIGDYTQQSQHVNSIAQVNDR